MVKNVTGNEFLLHLQRFDVYINASFSTLIAMIAILGNVTMIMIFARFKKLRDLNNTVVTILLTSDLIRASIVMPLKVYHQTSFFTELSEPTCTITAFVCGFTFVFSPMILALIGVVRYCKVVPWTNRSFALSGKRLYMGIATIFCIATTFAILPIVGITGKYRYSPSHGVCFTDWKDENKVFRSIFYMLVIGLAFPVLTACYILLFRALREHNKAVSQHLTKNRGGSNPITDKRIGSTNGVITNHNTIKMEEIGIPKNGDIATVTEGSSIDIKENQGSEHKVCCENYPHTGQEHKDNNLNEITRSKSCCHYRNEKRSKAKTKNKNKEDRQKLRSTSSTSLKDKFMNTIFKASNLHATPFCCNISKTELQVTRVMMIIFVAYCVCWFPAAILNAMKIYHPGSIERNYPCIDFYIVVTLVELKCALNPIIYGIGNQKYRKVIRNMIKKLKCWDY